MKRAVILLFSLLIFFGSVYAQGNDERKAAVGFAFSSFGDLEFINSGQMGAPSYEISHFYALGVVLVLPVNNWLDFEGGVEFKRFKVLISPAPGINRPSYTEQMSMVDVPLLLRATFFKYAFANGGLIINNNSPINSSGIGIRLGIGLKYEIQRITVFVNPYASANSIIRYSSDDYGRLLESGIRLGLTFKL